MSFIRYCNDVGTIKQINEVNERNSKNNVAFLTAAYNGLFENNNNSQQTHTSQ